MTREEFYAMPEIASYFPLTFEPHAPKARWNSIQVKCADCDRYVPKPDTRGYVTRAPGDPAGYRDPGCPAYRMVAQALCPTCEKLTSVDYVLGLSPKGGLMFAGKMPDGRPGIWTSETAQRRSWWRRIVAFFRCGADKERSP